MRYPRWDIYNHPKAIARATTSSVGTAGSITTLNFVGAGIVAAASGDTATVTVAGGVSNADVVALAIALGWL